VDDLSLLKWYVDALHNTHWDCKGHGGAMFTMRKGATSSYSRKIKLNTRSSTETELVASDMYMPEMLWSLYFIQAQGYESECVGLYQDNISKQLLIKNGKFSSGRKTKHIKAKFFFIKDRIDSGEIKVTDCPAEQMWADVLSKLLQGIAYRTMRAELMNCPVTYEEEENPDAPEPKRTVALGWKTVTCKSRKPAPTKAPQECVGPNKQKQPTREPTRGERRTDRQVRVARIPQQVANRSTGGEVRSKQ
jgi:hypothetical protein